MMVISGFDWTNWKTTGLCLGLYVWGPCSLEHYYFRINRTIRISLSSDHLCMICKGYGETWDVSFVLCCTFNLNHVKHPLFKLNQRWALDLPLPRSWSTRPFPLIPLSERAPFLSVRWKFCFCNLMICYQLATLFLASRWQRVTAPRLSGPLSCHQVFTIDKCFQPFKWSSTQISPKQMTFYVPRRTTAKRVSVKPMQGSISEEVRKFNSSVEEGEFDNF